MELFIKVLLAAFGICLALIPIILKKEKLIKVLAIIVGSLIFVSSLFDIFYSNYLDNKRDAKFDRLNTKITNDSIVLNKIASSLYKHNLKISGDSVIQIKNFNIKFEENNNNSTNVISNNQKGGQTAGTIINH